MKRINNITYIIIFILIIFSFGSIDSYASPAYSTQNYYGENTNHNKTIIQGKEVVSLDDSLVYSSLNDIYKMVADNKSNSDSISQTSEIPTYTINMKNGDGTIATVIPNSILEIIKGQDVNITFDMGGYSWTINGKSIREIKDVNLEVVFYDETGFEEIIKKTASKKPYVEFSMPYEGYFGFDAFLEFDIGNEYTGKYANIYSFSSDENEASFVDAFAIDKDGFTTVELSYSSNYIAVIGDDLSSKSNNSSSILFIIITILFIFVCIFIIFIIIKKPDYIKYLLICFLVIVIAYLSYIIIRPMNILVLGIDKRDTIYNESNMIGDNGQADYIAVIHVDILEGEFDIVSIPRETMVYLVSDNSVEDENIKNKRKHQICLQYAYATSSKEGCELMQQCLEDNFGLHTDCYIACSMGGITRIIDALGGVDIVPSRDYSYGSESINDWVYLSSGEIVHLDGASAYDFIHFRNIDEYYSNQDRLDRQRDFINAFRDKITISNVLTINAMSSLFELYNGYITTNMSSIDYTKLYLAYRKIGIDENSIVRVPGIETHTGMYDEYEITQEGLETILNICQ